MKVNYTQSTHLKKEIVWFIDGGAALADSAMYTDRGCKEGDKRCSFKEEEGRKMCQGSVGS